LFIGDFNTGNNALDKDPKGTPFINADMPRRLVDCGYVDLWRSRHPGIREYSWFSHTRNGFRLDHAFAVPTLAGRVTACEFDHEPRLLGETDHSALVVSFSAEA
jgi:exodeoxyribonuclease-3